MRDAQDTAQPPQPFRFSLSSLLMIVTVCAVLFGGYAWFHRRIVAPRQYSYAIERQIFSITKRRPKDLTPRQWKSAVAWTLNLHGNSLIESEADATSISQFDQRLAKKLAGDVDLMTIHWIWDEYAAMCPHGASYQRFRPQMMEEIEAGGIDYGGLSVP